MLLEWKSPGLKPERVPVDSLELLISGLLTERGSKGKVVPIRTTLGCVLSFPPWRGDAGSRVRVVSASSMVLMMDASTIMPVCLLLYASALHGNGIQDAR